MSDIKATAEDPFEIAKKNKGLPDGISTEAHLWDEILKREIFSMSFLIFPIIYKIFGKSYPKETIIVPFGTEYSVERTQTGDISSIRSDALFWIDSLLYHFECESDNDKEIAQRVFEYDTQSALACSKNKLTNDPGTLSFPYSVVLFLKAGIRKSDRLVCRMRFPILNLADADSGPVIGEQKDEKYVDYEVATLKVQTYTLQEINEQRLYILIPFTPLRFRPLLRKIEEQNYDIEFAKLELTNYFREIILILNKAVTDGYLSDTNSKDILSLLQKAMIRVFYKNEELLSEVISMTVPVLELPSETIARLTVSVREKDAAISEKDAAIFEKDAVIAEKEERIKELTAELFDLRNRSSRF